MRVQKYSAYHYNSYMKKKLENISYKESEFERCDLFNEPQFSLFFNNGEQERQEKSTLRVLSLFSGCGGMDLGFEGGFVCHRKSVVFDEWIDHQINNQWVLLRKTLFRTVFACDILKEAKSTWQKYMQRFNIDSDIYHLESIVDLVRLHKEGYNVFPSNIDVVTGGFPCQDFSVAGKRRGFESSVSHDGKRINDSKISIESRGQLYMWMKEVIDIVRPKMFIAENVKGLVSLGDVKDIIQRDFSSANGNEYIVL